MKNKKGFTLVEAIAVVGISGFTASLALNVLTDSRNKENLEVFSNDVANIISGFDKRLSNDKFEISDWSDYTSVSYEFNNRQQVSDFLSKELIAKDAPGCGKVDGWSPNFDSNKPVADEVYKNKFKFIDCNLWESKMPFDLNAKARILYSGDYLTDFQLDLFFDTQEDFENNFLSLKKVVSLVRNKDDSNKAGIHEYQFVSNLNGSSVSSKECITLGTDCMLRASFKGSDSEYEYLRTNGINNMVGSKVKFQEDITSADAIKECHRYKESGGTWSRIDSVYCGIGYGYSNPNDITSAKLDYVEVNASSVTTSRVFLGNTCSFQDSTGSVKDVPCGVYNQGTEVVAAYDELYASDALVSHLETIDLNTNMAKVKNDLTVEATSRLKGNLTVSGESTFQDMVTIEGTTADVNLIVESSATMKDVDITGGLNVAGSAVVTGDVDITGGLDVTGFAKITGNVDIAGSLDVGDKLSTKRVKLSQSITSSSLNKSCTAYGNGSIVYFSSGSFSDLAVCANNKWKLVNTQYNQVVAFNGSCPTGFKKFTAAEGRTLVGSGDLKEADGETYSYVLGGVGGQSKVGLTTEQMPSHQHESQDAYFSEHWGSVGPKTQIGSGDYDFDNNLYTRQVMSSSVGGSQAHENRMSYYVINWCTYEG